MKAADLQVGQRFRRPSWAIPGYARIKTISAVEDGLVIEHSHGASYLDHDEEVEIDG